MRRLLFPAIILLSGCGMEAVDIRMESRSESGIQQFSLEVVEGEFVCPHVVAIDNQAFDVRAVIAGEVENKFGPFVPCLTKVPSGEGECPNPACKQPYRTSGELAEGEEGAPLALPLLKCPHPHADGDQLIDPVAVFVKGSRDSILGYTNCPKCKNYFTIKETDLLITIDVHEEALCPICNRAVDPTMNACTNKSCKSEGVIRNIPDYEGPCWRCGGLGMCPNCKGSGSGNLGIYDKSPAECWTCGVEGKCPECKGTGFSRYEGTLPKEYKAYGRENKVFPSKKRKWEHRRDGGSGPPPSDMDDEDLGSPEEDDEPTGPDEIPGGDEESGGSKTRDDSGDGE